MTDPSGFSIRLVTLEDLPDLLTLIRKFASFEKVKDLPLNISDLERCFLTDPIGIAFLGRSKGTACAFATGSPLLATYHARQSLWIDTLYVHPNYRRLGIGEALLKTISDYAATHGMICVEWSCDRQNDAAQAFYDSAGAEELPWIVYRLNCRKD